MRPILYGGRTEARGRLFCMSQPAEVRQENERRTTLDESAKLRGS